MLEIFEAGLFNTIQDLGRNGSQQYGVTRGGAMDTLALRAANFLLGNTENAACIEIVSPNFSARALEKCVVSVTGAKYILRVGERLAPNNAALFLRAGDVLQFDAAEWGRYAYLGIPGGIDVPRVLGSRGTALRDGFGGVGGRALQTGDVLSSCENDFPLERAGKILGDAVKNYYARANPLRIIFGPHDEFFDDNAREKFLQNDFFVSDLSDRMGMRLRGEPIARNQGEVLSCGVTRGAIQIPPDGQPIVLQADHQTTGGYPILATVIRADIPRLAQKRAGARVHFELTTLPRAREALAEWDELLRVQ